jgi:ubiquinone/menaquinone biosynthesis C-methylase UbiE
MNANVPSPDRLLSAAFAFRTSQALLAAVALGVFPALQDGALRLGALVDKLSLHGRGARDFLDALVSLDFLGRDADGRYHNVPECALYLDPNQPTYVGGVLEYLSGSNYEAWSGLAVALKTGTPQAGPSAAGGYAAFYEDSARLERFLNAMTAGSLLPARALASVFPWHDYGSVIDIGTAQGCVPVVLAQAHPQLTGGGFDLPMLEPAFNRYVDRNGLRQRLKFHGGDFLRDPLPSADVLVMGRILHNWDLDTKKLLLAKAYTALPPGGALIVCETLIDDARRLRSHSLLASLNMVIQTAGGFEFTGAECAAWMREAGFETGSIMPLAAFYSAVVAKKPTVPQALVRPSRGS